MAIIKSIEEIMQTVKFKKWTNDIKSNLFKKILHKYEIMWYNKRRKL